MTKVNYSKAAFKRIKSAAILVLIPLAFVFILGGVFSKVFVEHIPLGILDMDNTAVSRSIVSQFRDTEYFKISYYAHSDDDLNEAIRSKKIVVGLIIPENFSKDVKDMKAPKTLLVVDGTNIVLGNNAFSYGSTILNTLNAAIQLNVLEGNGMVPYLAKKAVSSLTFTERVLYDPQISYLRYLFYGVLGIFTQQTFIGVFAPMMLEEREKLSKMKLRSKKGMKKISYMAFRYVGTVAMAFLGFALCCYFLGKVYDLPLRGDIATSFELLGIFILDLTAVSLVFASVFNKVLQCVQCSMFLSVPTFLTAGYVWPNFMMPAGFDAMVRKIWPLTFYINNLRNANIKGASAAMLQGNIDGGLKYAMFWLPVGAALYIIRILISKGKIKRLALTKKSEPQTQAE